MSVITISLQQLSAPVSFTSTAITIMENRARNNNLFIAGQGTHILNSVLAHLNSHKKKKDTVFNILLGVGKTGNSAGQKKCVD